MQDNEKGGGVMPYDNPFLKELGGYFKSPEPGVRERADAWATAIGLQKVDGLVPSQYLLDLAKRHIEGKLTQRQVSRRINDYYSAKDETNPPDPSKEEPDKVSELIVKVINDGAFEFTPEYYISIHARIFKGVLPFAGRLRKVNIRKREWILRDESVTYGSALTLRASLARCFADEREFDYSRLSARKMIPHFCRFIAQVWQIHPFGEGNTRTTAVFAVKYLRSLGFRTENNMFKDNSWYLRNALVRANFADFRYGVRRDLSFLEAFFRNLLLGENNLLKSRLLLIGMNDSERETMMASIGLAGGKGCQKKVVRKRLSKKGCQKTVEKLVGFMRDNPEVTQTDMACALSISRQAVQKHIARLKSAGRIRRIGPDKGGHWEVV